MNLRGFRISKAATMTALAFPLTFLALYLTLLVHLRFGLGHWPYHISDNPQTVLFHAHQVAASLLFIIGLIAVPISIVLAAALACAPSPRANRFATCLTLFAAAGLLTFAVMHLAPDGFMVWWWD